MAQTSISAQVIVVGAGFAGAAATRSLSRSGISVAVLEARDRVGGRAYSVDIGDGKIVDMGCEFVNPIVRKSAWEVGVGEFQTFSTGYNQMSINNKLRRWKKVAPPLNPAALLDLQQAIIRVDRLAALVPPESPWTTPNALRWDSETVSQWLDKNMVSRTGREVMRMSIETSMGASVNDISFLHLLNYSRWIGGVKALTSIAGGSLEYRFVGGAQNVVERMFATVNDSLYLRSAVRSIEDTGRRVVVRGDGFVAEGDYAIVTLPVPLLNSISFTPELSESRKRLSTFMKMGTVTKIQAIYSEPFWRRDGLSGMAVNQSGPIQGVLDGSPPDGSPGILTCFVSGNEAVGLSRMDEQERHRAIVKELERFFGPRALRPERIIEMNWSNEVYTGGCFHGICPPGLYTRYGALLAEPVGRIHFAGSETVPVEYGAMSGAVFSGSRSATLIKSLLGTDRSDPRIGIALEPDIAGLGPINMLTTMEVP